MTNIPPGLSIPQYKVDLEPIGRRMTVEPGTDLLTAAQKASIDLVAACGGVGICGTCRVRLIAGQLTPPTLTEQEILTGADLEQGVRLACQAVPLSDVRVEIPPESLLSAPQMQVDGLEGETLLDPAVEALDLRLEPPSLTDLRSDLSRANDAALASGYAPLTAEPRILADLSDQLRSNQWQARLGLHPRVDESSICAVLPVGKPLLGLAVDLGSTKLAIYLVDLQDGATLAKTGVMNPQIAFGEDVVSRIAFANQSVENRNLLQLRLIETLNQTVEELCGQVNASPAQIADMVAVGNTAMHHFFCGLPVEQLGAAPYVPAVAQPLNIRAADLGLRLASGARVYLPANIAGYVGADHTSALLTTTAYPRGRTVALVDIGTNTEISLIHGEKIYSCSCASGPAFEGAHIRDGMRAAPGAIESVHIDPEGVRIGVIGGQAPVGICGSGILQAVAELRAAGLMDQRGVLDRANPRMSEADGKPAFRLTAAAQTGHGRDILITRRDIKEIQLAKSAIRAGIEVLLKRAGLQAVAVDDWVIAGAFGSYLDLRSAVRVGLFPDQPLERFHQVGNAAGVGAKQMLLSRARRLISNQMVDRVEYIELTTDPDFSSEYVNYMIF